MNWEEIQKEYESSSITLKALAEKHGIKLGTLKSRKSREGWSKNATQKDATQTKKVATNKIRDATPEAKSNKTIEALVESDELTEKQRLFCIYYVKSFNATQAAIKAGYSPDTAHVQGPRLLGNVRVAEHIRAIKSDMTKDLFIEAMDVLRAYVSIAFADIKDYVSFGQKEVTVEDEDGNTVTQTVNYVDFKDAAYVDGTVIAEVKQGKAGISIKLEDRMKALDKLSLYFDLVPDTFKRKIEEEKARLNEQKYELDKRLVELREREEQTKGW